MKLIGFKSDIKLSRKKLLAMGLTPGVEVQVIRVAPLGDPVEIKVRGYSLTLRKAEYEMLIFEQSSLCNSCSQKGCHDA